MSDTGIPGIAAERIAIALRNRQELRRILLGGLERGMCGLFVVSGGDFHRRFQKIAKREIFWFLRHRMCCRAKSIRGRA